MWDLHDSIDDTDLVDGLYVGGEASMDAEDFALDDCSKRKEIEYVGYVLPDVAVAVLSLALVEKAVELGCLSGFMISS